MSAMLGEALGVPFMDALDEDLPVGALGRVVSVSGSSLLGALGGGRFALEQRTAIGDIVAVEVEQGMAIAFVHALRSGRRREDGAVIEAQVLGELRRHGEDATFRRGVTGLPRIGAPMHRADDATIARVFRSNGGTLRLGRLRQSSDVPAMADLDRLLGTHLAVLGSTGSGKSCAVTVLLRGLLEAAPFGHIVLIDPHNEYGAAFGELAERLGPHNLELPYWLLTFEELSAILTHRSSERSYGEQAVLREAVLAAKLAYAQADPSTSTITVDTPVPYRLSDLSRLLNDAMGQLGKPEGTAPYRQLLGRIESIRNDRRYAFMFQSLTLRDNLASIMARILRVPTQGRPVTTIDISGVPSEIVDIVVSVLFRTIFEFAVWAERGSLPPILLVCEEAHRYVSDRNDAALEPSRRAIGRIAKEGRKYGVSLCLVSQRPSELCPTSLSQCGSVVALRLTNERDQEFVRHILPDGSDWLLRSLPTLGTGEALVVGEGVPVPMLVELDRLAPEHQPASRTPRLSTAWACEAEPGAALVRTVERWRRQER